MGRDQKLVSKETSSVSDGLLTRKMLYDSEQNKILDIISGTGTQDVTASFRPDKAKHVKLTAEKAKKVIEGFGENAKLADTLTDNAMTYTNKLGERIKLAFDEAGNFLNAKTIVKMPISE